MSVLPATSLSEKEEKLSQLISGYQSVAVAYSGGVDSSYLSAICHSLLRDRARLVLADSPSIPRSEVADAVALANDRGWDLTVIQTNEFEKEEYLKNDERRCYFCKATLFSEMNAFAQTHQIKVLAYGAMADDDLDDRPGHKAAREYRVVAPLIEAGLGKEEIRELSRRLDLPTAGKASFACLSSRFPTGSRITPEKMGMVEAAEEVLREQGFHQFRARHHGDICRIEISMQDVAKLLDEEARNSVVERIRALGFRFVTLDLAGYKTGSVAAKP
jgi:uncharacterized protein